MAAFLPSPHPRAHSILDDGDDILPFLLLMTGTMMQNTPRTTATPVDLATMHYYRSTWFLFAVTLKLYVNGKTTVNQNLPFGLVQMSNQATMFSPRKTRHLGTRESYY